MGLSTQSLLARIELSIGRVLNFIFLRFLVLFSADICFQNGLLPKRHAVTMGILSTPSTTNDLVARISALLLGCGFPNVLDIVDAV